MQLLTVTLFNTLTVPIWSLWVVFAAVILGFASWIWVQCKRAAGRKLCTEPVCDPIEAAQSVSMAVSHICDGLLQHLRSEIGDKIPEDNKRIYRFVIENYSERNTGPYISIEAFVPFLQGRPYLYLQGSDTVGGVSVIPIRSTESGEENFCLEGLTVCYRNGAEHITKKFNIRFVSQKAGAPIEEVLYFEFDTKTVE